FPAEDGVRAFHVTGVQTCALPISIDQVSNNASESATVAQRSVAIAYNGAEVVQRSIEGMNVIRDQIQETSKRIKRLGESSQEIEIGRASGSGRGRGGGSVG